MDIHGPPLQILGKGPLVFSLHSEIDPQKGAPGMVFCCFCINIALPLESFAHFWEPATWSRHVAQLGSPEYQDLLFWGLFWGRWGLF